MKTSVCPELAEADISALRGHSGFDPKPTLAGSEHCTAVVSLLVPRSAILP